MVRVSTCKIEGGRDGGREGKRERRGRVQHFFLSGKISFG
jgi:hypothetical protein